MGAEITAEMHRLIEGITKINVTGNILNTLCSLYMGTVQNGVEWNRFNRGTLDKQ